MQQRSLASVTLKQSSALGSIDPVLRPLPRPQDRLALNARRSLAARAEGAWEEHRVAAILEPIELGRAVGAGARRWRVEKKDDAVAGCRMASEKLMAMTFV